MKKSHPLFPEPPPLPSTPRKFHDLTPEICLALLIPVAGVTGLVWLILNMPLPRCPFYAITDWPCLTCGMSSGTKELLHGEILAALRRNPLTLLLPATAIGVWICALLTLTARLQPIRPQNWSPVHQQRLRLTLLLLAALVWAYLILQKLWSA